MYKEAKMKAKEVLKGNWWRVIGAMLAYLVLIFLVYSIPFSMSYHRQMITEGGGSVSTGYRLLEGLFNLIYILIATPLGYGFVRYTMNLYRKEEAKLGVLFYGFKKFWNLILITIRYILKFWIPICIFLLTGIFGAVAFVTNVATERVTEEMLARTPILASTWIIIICILVALAYLLYISLSYYFVFYLYADGHEKQTNWKEYGELLDETKRICKNYLDKIFFFPLAYLWWFVDIFVVLLIGGIAMGAAAVAMPGMLAPNIIGMGILMTIYLIGVMFLSIYMAFGYIALYDILKEKSVEDKKRPMGGFHWVLLTCVIVGVISMSGIFVLNYLVPLEGEEGNAIRIFEQLSEQYGDFENQE